MSVEGAEDAVERADVAASNVRFRVCPRCGRDNSVSLLVDQPCEGGAT